MHSRDMRKSKRRVNRTKLTIWILCLTCSFQKEKFLIPLKNCPPCVTKPSPVISLFIPPSSISDAVIYIWVKAHEDRKEEETAEFASSEVYRWHKVESGQLKDLIVLCVTGKSAFKWSNANLLLSKDSRSSRELRLTPAECEQLYNTKQTITYCIFTSLSDFYD